MVEEARPRTVSVADEDAAPQDEGRKPCGGAPRSTNAASLPCGERSQRTNTG